MKYLFVIIAALIISAYFVVILPMNIVEINSELQYPVDEVALFQIRDSILAGRQENAETSYRLYADHILEQSMKKGDENSKAIFETIFPMSLPVTNNQRIFFDGVFNLNHTTDAVHIFLVLTDGESTIQMNYAIGYAEPDFVIGNNVVLVKSVTATLNDRNISMNENFVEDIREKTGRDLDGWSITTMGFRQISYLPTVSGSEEIELSVNLLKTGVFVEGRIHPPLATVQYSMVINQTYIYLTFLAAASVAYFGLILMNRISTNRVSGQNDRSDHMQ